MNYYANVIVSCIAATYKAYTAYEDPLISLGNDFSHFKFMIKTIRDLESINSEQVKPNLENYKKSIKRLDDAYPHLLFSHFNPHKVWLVNSKDVPGELAALGHLLKDDKAFVVANPKLSFEKTDPDAWSFAIKHECGHLVHHDSLWISIACKISILATSLLIYAGGPFLSLNTLMTLGSIFFANLVTGNFLMRIEESRADDFAIENSSDEELLGGRRLFIALQEIGKQIHTKGGLGGYLWTVLRGCPYGICSPRFL